MPIPRTLDYEFDPGHLRDLENVANGGNGCAREGQSAFRMETNWEGYVWGGGGAMAQRSAKSLRRDSDGGQDEESIRTSEIQGLLAELPGIMDD